MALKNTLDPAAVGEKLATWLPSALDVAGPVAVTNLEIPTASGMSSETVLLDASDGNTTRGLVVRVPPEIGLFPDYDIAREARVMTALATNSDAPVPKVVAHESTGEVLGSEFLLVERAYGRVPGHDPPFVTGGWVVDLPAEDRATMYDSALRAIAAIQSVDPSTAGLGELLHADLGATTVEQEFEYWRRFYAWTGGNRRSPLIDAAFETLAPSRPTADEAAALLTCASSADEPLLRRRVRVRAPPLTPRGSNGLSASGAARRRRSIPPSSKRRRARTGVDLPRFLCPGSSVAGDPLRRALWDGEVEQVGEDLCGGVVESSQRSSPVHGAACARLGKRRSLKTPTTP
jgi:hypothetical protein